MKSNLLQASGVFQPSSGKTRLIHNNNYGLFIFILYLCLYDEYNIVHPLIVKLFFPDTAEIGAPDTVSHIMLRFMFTISPIRYIKTVKQQTLIALNTMTIT